MVSSLLKVRSSVKGVGRAPAFVQIFCQENAIPDKIASQLCVALDEILPGIAKITTSPRIHLEIIKNAQSLEFLITHESASYDISNQQAIRWPPDAENSRLSELSLQIVHKLLNKIECYPSGSMNTTRLIKNLEQ